MCGGRSASAAQCAPGGGNVVCTCRFQFSGSCLHNGVCEAAQVHGGMFTSDLLGCVLQLAQPVHGYETISVQQFAEILQIQWKRKPLLSMCTHCF